MSDARLEEIEQRLVAALDSLNERIQQINKILGENLDVRMYCMKCGASTVLAKTTCPKCGSKALTPV